MDNNQTFVAICILAYRIFADAGSTQSVPHICLRKWWCFLAEVLSFDSTASEACDYRLEHLSSDPLRTSFWMDPHTSLSFAMAGIQSEATQLPQSYGNQDHIIPARARTYPRRSLNETYYYIRWNHNLSMNDWWCLNASLMCNIMWRFRLWYEVNMCYLDKWLQLG